MSCATKYTAPIGAVFALWLTFSEIVISLLSKKRPLRGNKTMPSAEKQEWNSVKVYNESKCQSLRQRTESPYARPLLIMKALELKKMRLRERVPLTVLLQ